MEYVLEYVHKLWIWFTGPREQCGHWPILSIITKIKTNSSCVRGTSILTSSYQAAVVAFAGNSEVWKSFFKPEHFHSLIPSLCVPLGYLSSRENKKQPCPRAKTASERILRKASEATDCVSQCDSSCHPSPPHLERTKEVSSEGGQLRLVLQCGPRK